MKLKYTLPLALLTLSAPAAAQISINFEDEDYKSIGVYDTWEQSPFRTHQLNGNYAVIDNHLTQEEEILGMAPNASAKILAVQRSRFGSNTFGARIDLKETFELTPTMKYIHVLVNRPYSGRVMVIGLGKRRERAGQSPEAEQFWGMTTSNIPADRWQEVVVGVKGNGGIDIYSLVIVPDCESPHAYTEDAICYIDAIEINDDPQPRFSYDFYITNFDKNQNATRSDRWLHSISFSSPSGGAQTRTLPTSPKRIYADMTAQPLLAKAGETITPTFNYSGSWMHGYVYMDADNNGKFDVSTTDDNNVTADSEILSYSYYKGKNSAGQSISVNNANVLNPPTFTLPTDLPNGFYRLRYKVDWDCVDPAGNADPSNSIWANGGNVVDVMVNLHGDNCLVSTASRNGEVITPEGEKLNNYATPFGQPFTIQMLPENGFEYAGIIIKHGYNLDGDSIVNDNRQWREVRVSRTNFTEDHQYTIPAEYMDGNVEVEGLFIEEGTYVPEQKPTRFTTTVVNEDFADTTSWYTIQIGREGYVLADNGTASYIALNVTECDAENPAHLWCFTGNDEDGYHLYNQQAGPEKVLAAPTTMLGTTGAGSYPTMQPLASLPAGYTATWKFMDSSDLGSTGPSYAYMYEDGYVANKVNNRDNKLAFWNGGQDAGSTLRVLFAYKNTGTGISTAVTRNADGSCYDLAGRRVSTPGKGIYIIGGKKHYVK